MTFDFILLALIQNQMPIEISRYEDNTPLYCLEDASTLNEYVNSNYVFDNNITSAKNYFIQKLDEYEAKYGPFPDYAPEALDLSTNAAAKFYSDVSVAMTPVQSMERRGTMTSEQSLLFYTVAHSYKSYSDKSDENEQHQIFKAILDNNELGDKTTMLTKQDVRYVCLPAPR